MSRWTENFSMYSDISIRISERSSSNSTLPAPLLALSLTYASWAQEEEAAQRLVTGEARARTIDHSTAENSAVLPGQ